MLSVICAALVCGILTDMSAKTSFEKLIRLLCSVFLAVTVVYPLIRYRFPGWNADMSIFQPGDEDAVAQGEKIYFQSIASIIRTETEAYILKEAKSIGADLTVAVELDAGNPPAPESVTIRGNFEASVETTLSLLIADELGIPKEHQTWIRQQPHSYDSSSPDTSIFS